MIRKHLKLGKQAPRHDLRTLHLADFLVGGLPVSPPARDWVDGLPDDLGMMLNDKIGDCGFASQAHAVQTWTGARGSMVTLTDAQVQTAYSACTGYTPADPNTDRGVVLLDALNQWRSDGIGGHKVGAYVKVDHHNVEHLKAAINLGGGLYVGAGLPTSAQNEQRWNGPAGALLGADAVGGWGGHCMWCPKYDRDGVEFITWGARQPADWQWFVDYVDEAYMLISPDWVTGASPAPNGFDINRLTAALAQL